MQLTSNNQLAIDELVRRADNGVIAAMRQLAQIASTPNPWGLSRAEAYKYCLMAAFLGDTEAHRQAAALFDDIPTDIEMAATEEVEDWIGAKADALEDGDIENWSAELLQWLLSHSDLH